MSAEPGEIGGMSESLAENSFKVEKQVPDTNNGSISMENGLADGIMHSDESYDQLLEMVGDLKIQNEFFKSQFEGLKNLQAEHDGADLKTQVSGQEGMESTIVKELHERIESVSRELNEEKQTRCAAEEALKHLREQYFEADAKSQELSSNLAKAQQKWNHEIKEREEKYNDLDSKFNRLHKRAKQRIQEIQKEKDDVEARLREVNETAERAATQQSALQQELERTRQQANEALRAMDAERQQLRSSNNKLRDNIEELRLSLQPKENALEALEKSLQEKDQMLVDMQRLLQAADDKKQAAITELAAKHQKNLESVEAQLADALSDRNKAAESISALQVLIAEKEFKIAEMDATSTGEAARLRASIESIKGELAYLKEEHEKEKKNWEDVSQALKTKLEAAESNCIRLEIEAEKIRSQRESDMSVQNQVLTTKDALLKAAREEISRLEREFTSYKTRAHALLQKKDAELIAAKDSEQLQALEEALKEVEKELHLVSAERDRVTQNLQDVLANHEKELAERDVALNDAQQQIKSIEVKLDSAKASYQTEKQSWEINLKNLEETWHRRCEALSAENEASLGQDLQKELGELKLRYKKLKEEHDSFRDLADRMIEEKDREISKLSDENRNFQRSLELRTTSRADHNDNYNNVSQKQESTSAAEHQILILARQQAQREEELAQSQRHILALQEEIEELERENRLHNQQESMLKTELREMERNQKRGGVDMTYLKNVILKLLETGEVEALLPVVAMLLQFSPQEMQKCQHAYHSSTEVPPSPGSDAPGSARSLFSRFSFS